MAQESPLSGPPGELCILRLSSLGDVTHVLPVVDVLRRHWPRTRLSWVIGRSELPLIEGLRGIELVPFAKRPALAGMLDLRRRLKGCRFDALLHMQVATRANVLSRLIRAPVRIGWDRPRARELHHWFCTHHVAAVPFQHQVDAFLEFVVALGLPRPDEPRWRLPVAESSGEWVETRLEEFDWPAAAGERLLVISASSSHPSRNWGFGHYARVAEAACTDFGFRVVLAGGPSPTEAELAALIQRHCASPVLNLVGKDTLEHSKALLRRADLVISPDSGPAHIASALRTPVLGLYASTWSRRSGPYRSLPLCVDRFPEAARRYRGCEPEALRWGTRIEDAGVMELIRPRDVLDKLQAFVAG